MKEWKMVVNCNTAPGNEWMFVLYCPSRCWGGKGFVKWNTSVNFEQ